jgi:N-acetylglutamate synthase-like GNAT family acetyltransferase
MKIREFKIKDADEVVEILRLNDQYSLLLEGPEAMKKVSECESAVYLVAEIEGKVVGVIKGIYDGSRALIHQVSVHPKYQKSGIGSTLVRAVARKFKKMGAPTVAVTASLRSRDFFGKLGFEEFPYAVFMVAYSIDEVIKTRNP